MRFESKHTKKHRSKSFVSSARLSLEESRQRSDIYDLFFSQKNPFTTKVEGGWPGEDIEDEEENALDQRQRFVNTCQNYQVLKL